MGTRIASLRALRANGDGVQRTFPISSPAARPLQEIPTRRGSATLRCVQTRSDFGCCSADLAQHGPKCLQRRAMHHSSEMHRFYTNRYHKKVCPRCARPNIVPVTRCGYCDLLLTDSDIRLVGRDLLRDLVSARTPHHSQAQRLHGTKAPSGQVTTCSHVLSEQLPDPAIRRPFRPGTLEELYRCYEFVVIRYPFPVAGLHLSAVPKGTVYDIKQLRRAHIPLLQKMQQQTAAFASQLVNELVATRGLGGDAARSYHVLESDDEQRDVTGSPEKVGAVFSVKKSAPAGIPGSGPAPRRIIELLKNSVIFGFSYPCGFGQVNMHAIAPPITNYNMFEAPFFYPLKKVLQDLREFGSVQPFEHDYESSRVKCDCILEEMKEVDMVVRRALRLAPGPQGEKHL